jgi:hypothetical protein
LYINCFPDVNSRRKIHSGSRVGGRIRLGSSGPVTITDKTAYAFFLLCPLLYITAGFDIIRTGYRKMSCGIGEE